jgi:UDP-N-acetylmuramoylalanine--D-glutamate ligase
LTKTAIIGLGITGLSCLRYLYGSDDVVVLDTRLDPPNGSAVQREFPAVECRFGIQDYDYAGVDRVIVSPGLGLDSCLVKAARAARVELSSDIDLFCNAAQAPITAITGTNGKSTVTSLVGHFLGALGRSPGVGGNLGEPALDLLNDQRDSYVIELSSFQLERLGRHPFHAATILNVSEDHLDRHGTVADYLASKQRVYRDCQLAVVNRHDPQTSPEALVPRLVSFGLDSPSENDWGVVDGYLGRGGEPMLKAQELPIAGRHNVLNVLAAFALVYTDDVDRQALAEAARSFSGLPHRCERVAEIDGVDYVNDSKATNVGATIAALQGLGDSSIPGLILIAGGDGKGADFSPLKEIVQRFVKHVVLLGADADAIEGALLSTVPVSRVATMEEAVACARDAARPGDKVLLSPACASFDMFANFADRGERFAAVVQELAA